MVRERDYSMMITKQKDWTVEKIDIGTKAKKVNIRAIVITDIKTGEITKHASSRQADRDYDWVYGSTTSGVLKKYLTKGRYIAEYET